MVTPLKRGFICVVKKHRIASKQKSEEKSCLDSDV